MSETNGESRATATRSAIPWGCAGMLGLVLTFETLFSGAALDLLRPEYWLWYATGQSAWHEATGASVLCLGSSQTNYGVVPQVLQERLGRPVFNLAMCGAPPHATYYLLKRALAAGGHPQAIVLDLNPHMMAVGYWGSIRFFPNLLSVEESVELGWTARDPDFTTQVLLSRLFPSVLARFEIRNAIQAALQGKPHSLRQPTLNCLWNRENNQGAMVLPLKPGAPVEVTPSDYEWFAPPSWRHEPLNTVYCRRLLKLAAANDIKVFLLIPPIDARLEALRDQKGLADAFREFARGLQAHHENLIVVEGTHADYPRSVFHDAVHVNKTGAVVLTEDLAEIIRPYLDPLAASPTKWVALPRFRDRTKELPQVVEIGDAGKNSLPARLLR